MRLLVILAVLCAGAAHADSSQFPWAAADTAFATAAVPTVGQLMGKWDLIGLAENPVTDDDIMGYWPDGKFQDPDLVLTGYFYQQVAVTSSTDAFGAPSFSWDEKRIGAETGHVYRDFLYTGSYISTGVLLIAKATSADCGTTMECRMDLAQSMLLCRLINPDTRPSCRQESDNNLQVSYLAYQQLNPAPRK